MAHITIPQLDAATINQRIDILQLIQFDTQLKKVAETGGGEFAGPCPKCGGDDRFRVQLKAPPGKRPEGNRWMCRQCSPKWSDPIGYVMWRDSIKFVDAMKTLSEVTSITPLTNSLPKQAISEEINRPVWVNTAFDFIEESQNQLWTPVGEKALTYLRWRGLENETLKHWGIGYNPTSGYGVAKEWGLSDDEKIYIPKGIVIPCQDAEGLHYVKVRQKDGEPKYFIIKGGHMWSFGLVTFREAFTSLLFEGEFDAMLAWQTGLGIGCASLPAGQALRPEYSRFFEPINDVVVCYDNDEPGRNAALKLCKILGFHNSIPLPEGKDLTEYYLLGGNIFDWVCSVLEAI